MEKAEIILYQSEDGSPKIEVRLVDETVWLTLNQMAELFQKAKSTISEHIRHIFDEGELPGNEATVRKFRTVQNEGGRDVERALDFYNLDVIISVGYRVKSHRGTQFRIWATQRLREYIIKGFTLDDERISRQLAEELAEQQYEQFKARQQEAARLESLKELENDLKNLKPGNKKKP